MRKLSIILFSVTVLLLAGCGVLGGPADSINDPRPTNTPVRWYPLPATPTSIPTVTEPAQIPMTGGLIAPSVSVDVATNCRRGPSANYDVLLAFMPGQTGSVIGKFTPTNYYVIRTDTGYTCWLWGQNAIIDGSTDMVPDVPPPPLPTSTSVPPAQPQFIPPQPTSTPRPIITPAPTEVPIVVPTQAPPPPPEPKPTKPPKPPKPGKCQWPFCGGGGGGGWNGNGHGNGGFVLLAFYL